MKRSLVLLAFGAFLGASNLVAADEPRPAGELVAINGLKVEPATITLRGRESMQQLLATGDLADGALRDLTHRVNYRVSNEAVARVSKDGMLVPAGNGKTEIVAEYNGKSTTVAVTVSDCEHDLPISFPNQIVPIFTKLGCNAGGCHGKASGQNGFKLSLLGFEPDYDHEALVKEGRGRRVFPAAPDRSLLLQKATGQVPHGGGKRMESDSHEYRLIRRWIATGLPPGLPSDPVVTKISVYPEQRTVGRGGEQQITVTAHYNNGSTEDVTLQARFDSNEQEIAVVDERGFVTANDLSGEAGIMTRYQGHVAVFRATVPLGLPIASYPQFPANNFIDQHTLTKWKQLGVVPSDVCTDAEFIRRAMLDICGTLPTPQELQEFLANADPQKRNKLVDQLLDRPEYADYFTVKWADILRVKRRGNANFRRGTYSFHRWIRQQLYNDVPYDQFVRAIVASQGDVATNPPVAWYREIRSTEMAVDDSAQVFLGLRIQCARCHHHPFEKWSQDDYYGFAAFFARVGRKPGEVPDEPRIFAARSGEATNPKTNQVKKPKGLDAPELDVPTDRDRRQYLADWLRDPNNGFFAKAAVNRMWAHFFSRGIVAPEDDMRVTNPPSNPELLDALAKDFVASGFSLKHLIRTIANSRTYQLSSIPNDYNKHDKQNYARYYPKRMQAEVMHDAICQVTNSPTNFGGLPPGTRATQLPDESSATYFLTVFGKPQRESACECERVGQANLAQSLHLLNSNEIQGKISAGGARADLLNNNKDRSASQKIEELWLWCFSRTPTADEMKTAVDYLEAKKANQKAAWEDLIWALINTKEFLFND